jgi:uncharacterized protein
MEELKLNQQVVEEVVKNVKQALQGAEAGHDWFHVNRVYKIAMQIAEKEKANRYIVALAALLHDIADPKFHGGDETIGLEKARGILEAQKVDQKVVEEVLRIIDNVSFKGGNVNQTFNSLELEIVQDADRLDAIGAIGIARTFHYGGFKNREMYNPSVPPKLNMTKEEYRASSAPTINHFYEKLLLLKDRMNTGTAKMLAEGRHMFMEEYLRQFYKEWEGEV